MTTRNKLIPTGELHAVKEIVEEELEKLKLC